MGQQVIIIYELDTEINILIYTLVIYYYFFKINITFLLTKSEPDMISGDGIYSRYLTWTPGPGRYILTAKVTESGASAIGITGRLTKFNSSAFHI